VCVCVCVCDVRIAQILGCATHLLERIRSCRQREGLARPEQELALHTTPSTITACALRWESTFFHHSKVVPLMPNTAITV